MSRRSRWHEDTFRPGQVGDAILLQALDAVSVSALPDDLPGDIAVDLAALVDLHSAIQVGDLPVDRAKAEVLTPRDELVFKLVAPQLREEEEEVAAPEEAAGAAEGGAEAQGETEESSEE